MDLHNPNRYRTRRRINRIKEFIWTVLVRAMVLVFVLVIIYFCIPWMSAMLDALRMH